MWWVLFHALASNVFGAIFARLVSAAVITKAPANLPVPPVAVSAYSLKQVAPRWNLGASYRGMAHVMVIQVIALISVAPFPEISLSFPRGLFDQP